MALTLTSVAIAGVPGKPRTVSRVGLGAMLLSIGDRPPREAAKAVLRRAIELGVTLVDTADVYALDQDDIGHNERLIAETLHEMGLRAGDGETRILVATKGGRTRPGGRWEHDGRPERLREACHASLRALGVERIALYQFHSPDPAVPFVESVGALARLREEGKVDAVGLSNVRIAEIREAQALVPVATVQNVFSAWEAGWRRSRLLDLCEREGMILLAYSPLGGRRRAQALSDQPALSALAKEVHASPQELALAWLLRQSPAIVPIPGTTRASRLASIVRSATLELDAGAGRRLDAAVRKLSGGSLAGRLTAALRRRFRR